MKIAITGHTHGIGRALAQQYEQRGHTIVGLSKREGNDIRNINSIADKIESCDLFINNAQQGYAQTDLLFEVQRRWQGLDKEIIVISTMSTMSGPQPEHVEYYVQKVALENAVLELAKSSPWPKITLIRPGEVHTGSHSTETACDVDQWAETVVRLIETVPPELRLFEFSLGSNYEQ
jgi:nucleoside-diphosphate-sugar epimerase